MDGFVSRWALVDLTSPLLLWLLGSVSAYVLAANALWVVRDTWRPSHRLWMVEVGRFFFYLAIPYLVLGGWPQRPYQGLLSLEDMGLVGLGGRWPVTRWLGAAGAGLGWGLIAFLILLLAWANANRLAHGARLQFSSRQWWLILLDVFYLEVHWAFYRGALAVTLDDVYAGIFWGLGLIYLQHSLNPFWRQGWRLQSQAATCWLRAALVFIIAVLFFLTRNLWICLLVHWLLEGFLRQLGRERALKASAQPLESSQEPANSFSSNVA
jgi:hypothetical protein